MQKAEPRPQTAGEKFEKTVSEIREALGTADEKSRKGVEPSDELAAIKTKRASLEELDSVLKSDFAATETRLKSAKLPKTILDRHYVFVKFYQSNLKELIGNLEQLERAEKKSEVNAAVRKAKEHLEKTQPKKLVQRLDPNNLPHQNRKLKGKPREPRSKEQFERDFPKRKAAGKKIADSRLTDDFPAADSRRSAQILNAAGLKSEKGDKPVLLAFNEPISDVPFSLGFDSSIPHSAFAIPNFMVAQAAQDLPAAEDLAETPDIQFSRPIKDLAAQLGYSPLRIYEWVRNSIEYAPTYGSIQGADQCLQSKICNDMDTASLLIGLLRVSGIAARYQYSTVQLDIDRAMNLVGGVTDPKMVGTILATNGIPVKVLISGGRIVAVQFERVTVRAFVDYIPSRGAVHKQGDTFIPLDPSYKQYIYTQGIDIKTAVPFDAQTFANQILSTATTNTVDGSVTNVNSALVQTTMQDYQTQVQNYVQQNYPNATVGDVIGKKEIVKEDFPFLPGTLPYKTVQVGSEFATVPDTLRETMSFNIPDQTGSGAGLTYSTSLPQIAGKKITLSFSPATANDQAVIESLLPQPHADGTPIQPSELPSSFPAYLINLKPELRIDGQVVATGSSVTMGSAQPFTMSLNEPGIGMSNIDNVVKAGEYFGIGVDTGRIGIKRLQNLMTKLEATKAKLKMQNSTGLTKDDVVGDLLFTTITAYFQALDNSDEVAAKTQGIIHYRVPSVGMYSVQLGVQEIFGIPKSAGFAGMMMDVDRIMQAVFSKDGNMARVKQYMLASGSMSSALEQLIPEQLYSTSNNTIQGVSAVKALQIASSQGIPTYIVTPKNIAIVLPQLEVSPDVKNDIVNAINAGKQVIVSKSNVTLNGWTGCGFIITDPITGAGAYMISGGQSGALIIMAIGVLFMILGILLAPTGLGIAIAIYGAMLFALGAYALINNSNPTCNTSFGTCVNTCWNTLNQPWTNYASTGVGFAALLEALSASYSVTPFTLVLDLPVFTGLATIFLGWSVGSVIGCSAVCASDACYYN